MAKPLSLINKTHVPTPPQLYKRADNTQLADDRESRWH